GNVEAGYRDQVAEARDQRQHHPGEEPADRFACAQTNHGAEGAEQPPQNDAAGVDEVAYGPLHHKGGQQEQGQLTGAETCEVAGADVVDQIEGQQQLVDKGQGAGKAGAEGTVDQEPQSRGDANEAGGEYQQGLVETFALVVFRRDAGLLETCQETVRNCRIHCGCCTPFRICNCQGVWQGQAPGSRQLSPCDQW